MQWYRTAYQVAREIDDRQVLAWALDNVSNILGDLGDFRRALAYKESVLRIVLEINDTWTACLTLANFGWIFKGLRYCRQAEAVYRQAVELGRKLDIPSYLSSIATDLATLLLEQRQINEAEALYGEAQDLASRVEGQRLAGEDVRFDLAILGIRLRCAQGRLTQREAVIELEQMLSERHMPEQQAALHFEAWRIDPSLESHRAQAAEQYRTLGLDVPLHLYRQRYRELTGESLPEPPPLPDLPDISIPDHFDVESLAAHLKAVAANLVSTLTSPVFQRDIMHT